MGFYNISNGDLDCILFPVNNDVPRYGSQRIMKVSDFWNMAPCSLTDVCWHFKAGCCLHHQLMIEAARPPKELPY